jgi:hypothetical protein
MIYISIAGKRPKMSRIDEIRAIGKSKTNEWVMYQDQPISPKEARAIVRLFNRMPNRVKQRIDVMLSGALGVYDLSEAIRILAP